MLRTAVLLVILLGGMAPLAIGATAPQLAVPSQPIEDPVRIPIDDPYMPLGMDIFSPPADWGEEPSPLDPAED